MNSVLILASAFILDLIFGDPAWLPHPIRLIGWMISRGEKVLRALLPRQPFLAGTILTIGVTSLSFAIPAMVLILATRISPVLALVLHIGYCFQILAANSLRKESLKVYAPLNTGDLPAARQALAMIVGRDTQNLDARQVTRAAVETVAENTSDGVIAPLFYIALGGAPLGFLYKAINTLDSMIGYKNERYLQFGRFAARLDDVANYLPARLTGLLMIAASPFCGLDAANAWRVFWRDRKNHSSPNSAHPESAAAGALNIQLAGNASYFGKLVHKPTIGDANRPIETDDIRRVNRLMLSAAVLAFLLLSGLRLGEGLLR